jgi:hypothetical protein
MRRLLVLAALLTGIVGWSSLGDAQADQMCSVSCSGATLQCCVSSGSCTSSPGQIECNGVVHTCAEWEAEREVAGNCVDNCMAAYNACLPSCSTVTCAGSCARTRNNCILNCPNLPQTNWGC